MSDINNFNPRKNDPREKKKKILLVGIVLCIITIVVLALMIYFYQQQDAKTFKLYIDGYQSTKFSNDFYITTDSNVTYVKARAIADFVGWKYQNGEYGAYTEDIDSGYMQSDYEVVSFVTGSNIIKKYIEVTAKDVTNDRGDVITKAYKADSENGTLETMQISSPILSSNGQIYFPLNCLSEICNAYVQYTNPYRMYIYSQNYLIKLAQTNASKYGYSQISGTYENMRLLPYKMMVVKSGSNFGAVGLFDGKEVIGFKYSDMVFVQNVKEFFIKTVVAGEESIGIISMQGSQIVEPKKYSKIQVLSDDLGLYLVQKNGDYGVLNRKGEVVVHCEYDSIGIPEKVLETFEFSIEDNKYLLFDNTIIVEDSDKYGLYDTDGNQTALPSYLGFGYIASEDDGAVKNAENVLTITLDELELSNGEVKDVKAVIVKQMIDNTVKYGVYDTESKKQILPCIYNRIYSITSKGNTEYYIEFQGTTVKFKDQLAQNPSIFEKTTTN